MNPEIHFEQLIEEIRAANPQANTICATEVPLEVMLDDTPLNLQPYLQVHEPVWLNISPASLRADGLTSVGVHAQFRAFANLQVTITLKQGETSIEQVIPLDGQGEGEIEVSTQTCADILVSVNDKFTRVNIPVVAEEED